MHKWYSCLRIFRESSSLVYWIRFKTSVTFSANIMQFFYCLFSQHCFGMLRKTPPSLLQWFIYLE